MTDEDGNLLNFNNQEFTMKLLISSTYELIIGSKSTFGQITQQASIQEQQQSQPSKIEETPDSDLDLLLYKSKQPIPLKLK